MGRTVMVKSIAFALGMLMCSGAALAQSGDAQIRQLRLQVRQSMQAARDAQQAATAAQAEVEQAKAAQDGLSRSLEEAEQARGELAGMVSQLRGARAALEARVAELTQALTDEQAAHGHTRDQLLDQTRARETAERDLAGHQTALATCRTHNGELAGVVDQLLHAYEEKGVFTIIGQHEPFTGIGQVRLENLLETYRDKLENATEASVEKP